MEETKSGREKMASCFYYVVRIGSLFSLFLMLLPALNPARVSGLINKNMSLFTTAVSYDGLVAECKRAFEKGWISEGSFKLLYAASILACIGIVLVGVTAIMSVGNLKMKKKGNIFAVIGSAMQIAGYIMIRVSYDQVLADATAANKLNRVEPMFSSRNFYMFLIAAVAILISTVAAHFILPRPMEDDKYEMESKYKLFLMFMPFAILAFAFSYLPLYGWRYSFFDYVSGGTLNKDNFVGLKWFTMLLKNEATRGDIVRVLKNTLAMSGLGIATSWCAMAFAIFLSEIKNLRIRRFIQTFTTIPNFISWVIVYALALALFSTDGFLSSIMVNTGIWTEGKNLLMSDQHIWLKMLAWGMWKGIGWSAIIYIAGISGIDQQLYEAATVDGAGRFQKMWHITVPGLIPTYMVLLLMSIAGILSNGMDQYLNFENARNSDVITVLDLYVYKLGINSGKIPLSTVIGMVKSVVSVFLLFTANAISKLIRNESII